VITVERTPWAAVVEVEDYAPLSAYDHQFARELCAVVTDLSDDDDVKVIVLRARGADFAAPVAAHPGFSPAAVTTTWHRDFAASDALCQVVCFSKKVVVTEVHGRCSGAGSLLVLCSDLTVASEDATFGSPFADHPEANFVLAALTVRLNRAKSWMLGSQPWDASTAAAAGLVNTTVPRTELEAATQRVVDSVVQMPLDGVTMSKMLQQAVMDAHGVGREFDLADHYAVHRWAVGSVTDPKRSARV
jgi:enoyl-CoA hydratase/carnithine racemase